MRTPGPWWVVKFEDKVCIDSADQGIARISPYANPNAEEDAAFIVTACNVHDELVAALEACRTSVCGYSIKTSSDWEKLARSLYEELMDRDKIVRQALAKAKGTP